MSFVALVISVIVAFIIGIVAVKFVPFDMPGGWVGAVIAGFIGAWIGHGLLGVWGPIVAGFAIIPALIGSIIFICILGLVAEFF